MCELCKIIGLVTSPSDEASRFALNRFTFQYTPLPPNKTFTATLLTTARPRVIPSTSPCLLNNSRASAYTSDMNSASNNARESPQTVALTKTRYHYQAYERCPITCGLG